jgi:hypothetical protein
MGSERTNEAFSRVKIDAQLRDQGWEVDNPNAVRFADSTFKAPPLPGSIGRVGLVCGPRLPPRG